MCKLLFSYDYELAWGVWDTLSPSYLVSNVANANYCAQEIMCLHEKYSIKASFAVVGAAVDKSVDFRKARALLVDSSATETQKRCFEILESDERYFRIPLELVEKICCSELFELCSHTYWHRYSNTCTSEQLDSDFKKFRLAVKRPDISSIVFPRNIVTRTAYRKAIEHGFNRLRVNPNNRLYRAIKKPGLTGKFIRFIRYIDSFVPVQEFLPNLNENLFEESRTTYGQYFFRAHCGGRIRDFLHLNRILLGVSICRGKNVDCHIWSHPHNFGKKPELALRNLEVLLEKMTTLMQNGSVSSLNMKEL